MREGGWYGGEALVVGGDVVGELVAVELDVAIEVSQ